MIVGSKGMRYLGEYPSGRKSKRARNGSGTAVCLNRVCQHCGEQRWKAHCKCKRNNTAGARGRKPEAMAKREALKKRDPKLVNHLD